MFKRNFESLLLSWLKSPHRKPLVVRGARQVGKTSLIQDFAQSHFTNFIYINLDKQDQFRLFASVSTLDEFAQTVNLTFQQSIYKPNTILFIDEIQNLPNLISLLRYFYEDLPELPVICAGSLLEVRLHKEQVSMPVGRVEYGYMYPLTFFEYLDAVGKSQLKDHLLNLDLANPQPLPDNIHHLATTAFRQYTLIGGMPELVALYTQTQDIEECKKVLSNISTTFTEDTRKYAQPDSIKYLEYIINTGPRLAGGVYKYKNFGDSNWRSREMSGAFDLLEKAMILKQVKSTNSSALPLLPKEKRAKKLLWLDVGLVNFSTNAYYRYLNLSTLDGLFRGRIAEQVVGQNLLASGDQFQLLDLMFWAKDKQEGTAEIDFVFQNQGRAVAVEVKSGSAGRAKSLQSFGQVFPDAVLLKVSEANLGKRGRVVLLPFYLINRAFDF